MPERKSAHRLIAMETAPLARWAPRDAATFAREGYGGNPIVHGAVRLIATGIASLPLVLSRGSEQLDAHPALDLLARPNPRDDRAAFLTRLVSNLLISGNAFAEMIRADGPPLELHVLRPDRMRVVPGADGWPVAYEYGLGTRSVTIRQDDGVPRVLHLTLFHPLDDHYGLSPLEAAARAVDTHNAATAWNKALLDNAARPSGALVYAGAEGSLLSDDQYQRLKDELEQTYQGAANAGRPLLLEGGLDWKPMSLTPKDMDFMEAKHAAAREIALVFGVPPVLLGIPGDATYANLREANAALWRQTILPLAQRIAGALSAFLSAGFGESLVLTPDADGVEALRKDRSTHWQAVNAATFLTLNEKRRELGFEPLPGGDVLAR
jgi:HK97 family phage portal protein